MNHHLSPPDSDDSNHMQVDGGQVDLPNINITQIDVITNTTGNVTAVDEILQDYVDCINGKLKGRCGCRCIQPLPVCVLYIYTFIFIVDPISDTCKLLDTQFRLQRSSAKDTDHLIKCIARESSRLTKAKRRIVSHEQHVKSLGVGSSNSNTSHSSNSSNSSNALTRENVVHVVVGGIESQHAFQMTALANAQLEEERAKKLYEAAKKKRSKCAAAASKTQEAYKTIQTQRQNALCVSSMRYHIEGYNDKSSHGRVHLLSSMKDLLRYISKDYVSSVCPVILMVEDL